MQAISGQTPSMRFLGSKPGLLRPIAAGWPIVFFWEEAQEVDRGAKAVNLKPVHRLRKTSSENNRSPIKERV